tara:strand:- start:5943 stop:6065 length:123 start_codon:yes stop_codon:yes gene_type:complete
MIFGYLALLILMVLPFLLERSYNFSWKEIDDFLKDDDEKN